MRGGGLRWLLVVVLLGLAAGTALFVQRQNARARAADTALDDINGRLDQIVSSLRAVSDAQLRYLTLGLTDAHSAASAQLLTKIADGAEALRGRVLSNGADAHLTAIADATRTVSSVDARARENVRAGDMLMAADLILTESRVAAASLEAELQALRSAETRTVAANRTRVLDAGWLAAGGAAGVWLVGLLLLVRLPRGFVAETTAPAAVAITPDVPTHVSPPTEPQPTIDLAAVAALCTDIARATTTMGLTELLSKAAAVLGAPGMIVWMASGDELFAALGVGYDPRVVARLGTIRDDADNATAVAWRTAEMQTVQGDMVSRGAIVAPLFGPDGCLGVLAVEVPNGRDTDPTTRAVTTMIGAQLATILAGWPSAPQQPVEAPGLVGHDDGLAPMRAEA